MRESDLATYYKLCVDDLLDTHEHFSSQKAFLQQEADEARAEKLLLEDALTKAGKDYAKLMKQYENEKEDAAKKIAGLNSVNLQKIRELMKIQSQEKKLLQKELTVSEKVREELTQGMEKLKVELKELKQIIKVPRLHYKNIESIDYDDLKT